MRVLGIDPGTLHLGWGLVERRAGHLTHVAHGVIDVPPSLPMPARLALIEQQLTSLVQAHQPHVASVETLFFHRDPTAAAKLGQARGVVLLCLERAQVAIAEYQPARVKRTLTGNGRADKRQVAQLVSVALKLGVLPRPDASDALALALTHLRAAPGVEGLIAPRVRAGRAQSAALAELAATRRVVVGHRR